jgi:hypothetical protein
MVAQMKILRFLPFVILMFGCEENKSIFNIYQELELAKNERESSYKEFLQGIVSHGVSYEDDKLTPNLANGKLFGDRNLTTVTISRYFIYSPNSSLDQKSTMFVHLEPSFSTHMKSYYDEHARLEQIKSYKPFEIKKPIIVAKEEQKRDPLPQGLLPPRLPNLSIGIGTPKLPDI